MTKIVILGAGISGLSLGWYLKKRFKNSLDLTMIEKNKTAGGWIKTIEKEGFLFELGPRSCRTAHNGVKTLQLVEELNLMDQVILPNPLQKKRYIYKDQKLIEIPSGILSLFSSPLKTSFFYAFYRDLFGKKALRVDDESIDEFAKRKFGSEIAKIFFDPLTSGIYAGNSRGLSLKSCFPILYELEQEYDSILKGMILKKRKIDEMSTFVQQTKKHPLFSFKNGMQTLTSALSQQLHSHLLFSSDMTKLDIGPSQTTLYFKTRPPIVADHVFSTIAPHHLAPLITLSPLNSYLNEFESASVAVVSLGFKTQVIKNQGFGYLIPSNENEEILGVVFDSFVFKEQNRSSNETRLTVMIGGDRFINFHRYNEDDFLNIALKAIRKHLNIETLPDVSHVRIARNAIAQYYVGHEKRVQAVQAVTPPHFQLLGSSFYGVSVNDCIAKSRIIAENF